MLMQQTHIAESEILCNFNNSNLFCTLKLLLYFRMSEPTAAAELGLHMEELTAQVKDWNGQYCLARIIPCF